jgi:hypothetical protein
MDDAKHELVRAWLAKARKRLNHGTRDWCIGGRTAGYRDLSLSASRGKSSEGFLAFHDHRLERTHDVERLVELARHYQESFQSYEDAAITLTPYATAYRYPGESATLEPSREEFNEALKLSTEMLTFVLSLLPEDVRPDK